MTKKIIRKFAWINRIYSPGSPPRPTDFKPD